MCEKDGNLRLQNGLNLLCMAVGYSFVVSVKKRHGLTFARFSKSVVTFSEKVIFEKFVKNLSPQKFQLFECFSI